MLLAIVITLYALVWSVPNIPTSYPSWYNLFFATLGPLRLFKHIETGRRRSGGLAVRAGGYNRTA